MQMPRGLRRPSRARRSGLASGPNETWDAEAVKCKARARRNSKPEVACMPHVTRRPRAQTDILEIWDYIADDRTAAADHWVDHLDASSGCWRRSRKAGRRAVRHSRRSPCRRRAAHCSSSRAAGRWWRSSRVGLFFFHGTEHCIEPGKGAIRFSWVHFRGKSPQRIGMGLT